VGYADARVPAIVDQLIMGEYLPASPQAPAATPADTNAPIYTRQIADAIEALQRDYGIAADGVVGPDTLGVLNLGAGDRARAIAVALERRRWLDRSPPATRIDVNIAAAQLQYVRDGLLIDTRRGSWAKPGTETPQLQSPIYRLVANPTWTVPSQPADLDRRRPHHSLFFPVLRCGSGRHRSTRLPSRHPSLGTPQVASRPEQGADACSEGASRRGVGEQPRPFAKCQPDRIACRRAVRQPGLGERAAARQRPA
jgi:hypothetical protein